MARLYGGPQAPPNKTEIFVFLRSFREKGKNHYVTL